MCINVCDILGKKLIWIQNIPEQNGSQKGAFVRATWVDVVSSSGTSNTSQHAKYAEVRQIRQIQKQRFQKHVLHCGITKTTTMSTSKNKLFSSTLNT